MQLTPRWYSLRYHPVQQALITEPKRFKTVPAGRRSGKTEWAKRKVVSAAVARKSRFFDPNYFVAAPTRAQAKRIYWNDLKRLIPKNLIKGKPSESELVIDLTIGSRLFVLGLDEPARAEGSPWDGGICDEYGNMKPETWPNHLRPAMSDRNGWVWFVGVPEGRNHYYDLDQKALKDKSGTWGSYSWKSSDILPAAEIAQAKQDLDELTYLQEYEGAFVTFSGRCYYGFLFNTHTATLKYDPNKPLILCFDFNVAPGVAAICQEQELPLPPKMILHENGLYYPEKIIGTGVIGEVYIPQNSNTPSVCRKIIADWGIHQGEVRVYGDATGGNKGSAKINGSDWDLVKEVFRNSPFASKVRYFVQRSNPTERSRVNAMNSRIKSSTGVIRFMVDPVKAPHVVKDFEGVRLLEGGSGEIDKKIDPKLTHISDAIGYYIVEEFPVVKTEAGMEDI